MKNAGAPGIDQKLVFTGSEDGKLVEIRQLVTAGLTPPVLIFVQDRRRAVHVFEEIAFDGISVEVIHGDRPESVRASVVARFRRGEVRCMFMHLLVSCPTALVLTRLHDFLFDEYFLLCLPHSLCATLARFSIS